MTLPSEFSIIARRFLTRRELLRGAAGAAAVAALPTLLARPASAGTSPLAFEELGFIGKDDPTHHVAPGHSANVLISWGDPLLPGAPAFDPLNQTAETQARQFGFNNDFIGYLPLSDGAESKQDHLAGADSTHGLLCVNHEYSMPFLMVPGLLDYDDGHAKATAERVAMEWQALGHSVMEVRLVGGVWSRVPDSGYARRFTVTTPFAIMGPARGHARMKTAADPEGTTALGTFHNCAGGVTPWGTILSGEENVHGYFVCDREALAASHPRELAGVESFDVKRNSPWRNFDPRFDINQAPHEFNRFGWVIEIDPYDPSSTPKKRTALGRFRHEGATVVAKAGAPVVVYMGDDQQLEHVYKFVSARAYAEGDPAANADILDEGTLYAGRFSEDGTGEWLPLVHGQGPLTVEGGFQDQGDVLINARQAARALGATETDRPEDIETDPITQRTYIAFTGGTERPEPNAVSPRAPNPFGHIVEILPPGSDGNRDHTATAFTWDILLLAGDPAAEESDGSAYGGPISKAGALAQPDNLVFDPKGRLWIATDGAKGIGSADGLWGCCVSGPERAITRRFFAVPTGGELTGPCFTPDGTTLFVAVQHPGYVKGSNFDTPVTRWPAAMDSALPPRPSVVAIRRDDGGPIGG